MLHGGHFRSVHKSLILFIYLWLKVYNIPLRVLSSKGLRYMNEAFGGLAERIKKLAG